MKEEQFNELQALLDAGTQGEWTNNGTGRLFIRVDRASSEDPTAVDAATACKFLNSAPALLEAARENLLLRDYVRVMRKSLLEWYDITGTQDHRESIQGLAKAIDAPFPELGKEPA